MIKEGRKGRVSLHRKSCRTFVARPSDRLFLAESVESSNECRCRCSYARVTTDFNANSFDEIIKHARFAVLLLGLWPLATRGIRSHVIVQFPAREHIPRGVTSIFLRRAFSFQTVIRTRPPWCWDLWCVLFVNSEGKFEMVKVFRTWTQRAYFKKQYSIPYRFP